MHHQANLTVAFFDDVETLWYVAWDKDLLA